MRLTIDKKHKYSDVFSYLWVNEEGELMASPIVHSNDKLELGRGYFSFKSEMTLPLNNSSRAIAEYEYAFKSSLIDEHLILQ